MKKLLAVISVIIIALFGFTTCTNQTPAETVNPSTGQTAPDNTETPDISADGEETKQPSETEQPDKQEVAKMFVTISGNKLEVTLAENAAAEALAERLKQGNITVTVNDHGGFEKYGGLGFSLPDDDTYITAEAGDVMLYLGNQIVLFYGSNSWDYTRLGRINGYSASELRTLLCGGSGKVQVTLSLK